MTAGDLLKQLADAHQDALGNVRNASSLAALDEARKSSVGKSGSLAAIRREIGSLDGEGRKTIGEALSAVQQEVASELTVREEQLLDAEPVLAEPFDVTLPASAVGSGGLHPTVQMMYDLNDGFTALNFTVYEGPEISSELFEFDYMNFPADHPARESMDTYWLAGSAGKGGEERLCLRPHLTGASIRYMRTHGAPLRMVYPGRVYRNESTDARHERAFFQYEALIIDRDVPLTAGKFLVDTILQTVFGRPIQTRMRTGFFPFVEPGFEIDMECTVCDGAGCRTCHYVGWLEVMPGGAPHPNVLRAGGLDPSDWTGFYVNVGLDRLVMMRYGIDDVRLLHSADLRFLGQFR
ncbi:MAG TPA: phenylalanine--tRNA ligase subunit alpha [Actinospica sp.]|jgi:phenylalanyl-tRNA synthetase alpha chain|nr:phenylalanine--tRNA ligase subunit alpha [Actinospica sp.]